MAYRDPADQAAYIKRWRAANRDKVAAAYARYRERHPRSTPPERNRAYVAVSTALKNGTLAREPCLFCDAEDVVAHHHDYERRLEVTWLCRHHHQLVHR